MGMWGRERRWDLKRGLGKAELALRLLSALSEVDLGGVQLELRERRGDVGVVVAGQSREV